MDTNAESLMAMRDEIDAAMSATIDVLRDIAKKHNATPGEQMDATVGCLAGMIVGILLKQGKGLNDMREIMERMWAVGQLYTHLT